MIASVGREELFPSNSISKSEKLKTNKIEYSPLVD